MRLFDTHCHLDFPPLANQVDLWPSCLEAGVCQLVVPGVLGRDWERVVHLTQTLEGVHAALGLHPGFVDQHRKEDLQRLADLAAHPGVVAIGEIGLDAWEGGAPLSRQQPWLEAQLALARSFRLPVILHVRKAHDQVLSLLRRAGLSQGGVVHAFSGSLQQADAYLKLGFRLGIGGAVTYPRAKKLQRTVAALPLDGMVLETDAPDMPLCGHQGQPNSPLRLPQVLAAVAALRPEPLERVAAQLYDNSCQLFNLPACPDGSTAPGGSLNHDCRG